jgi:hypothetical protein
VWVLVVWSGSAVVLGATLGRVIRTAEHHELGRDEPLEEQGPDWWSRAS